VPGMSSCLNCSAGTVSGSNNATVCNQCIPVLLLVCARLSHPPALDLRLSQHRHPFSIFPPSSRFIHYNKQAKVTSKSTN
jgi:hypothetical protein